jgi:hypothetical protein
MRIKRRWNGGDGGKQTYSEKNCPRATLSTTKPTLTGLALNPGLPGESAAAKFFSHGKVVAKTA